MFTILARETGSWCNEIRYQYNGIRSVFHFPKDETFESAEQRLRMILVKDKESSTKADANNTEVNNAEVNNTEIGQQKETDLVNTAKENGSRKADKQVPGQPSGRSVHSATKSKRIRQNTPDVEDQQKG